MFISRGSFYAFKRGIVKTKGEGENIIFNNLFFIRLFLSSKIEAARLRRIFFARLNFERIDSRCFLLFLVVVDVVVVVVDDNAVVDDDDVAVVGVSGVHVVVIDGGGVSAFDGSLVLLMLLLLLLSK
jgi:hypothetical protein